MDLEIIIGFGIWTNIEIAVLVASRVWIVGLFLPGGLLVRLKCMVHRLRVILRHRRQWMVFVYMVILILVLPALLISASDPSDSGSPRTLQLGLSLHVPHSTS
jgi:hypothetical protein